MLFLVALVEFLEFQTNVYMNLKTHNKIVLNSKILKDFQAFFRSDTTKEHSLTEGFPVDTVAGLGLAKCYPSEYYPP